MVLTTISPGFVTIEEAWLTFAFFPLVVILAVSADKLNERVQNAKKTKSELEDEERENKIKQQKFNLRQIAHNKGEDYVIKAAQGIHMPD